ncbi:hypothetical protein HaLaN_22911 [Haematococcus lacustris]|uniref:Uncharacterized protein n=1 Tax=Haematococcus lacustris TaxID=44745 RepID=A0A699ZRQ1_HAELA|nr:hypothetical protein HaLaN_22911 [Haematococcus lacustris]
MSCTTWYTPGKTAWLQVHLDHIVLSLTRRLLQQPPQHQPGPRKCVMGCLPPTSSAIALPFCCSPALVGYRAMRCPTTKEVCVVKVSPVSPSMPVPGWTTWWWLKAPSQHLVRKAGAKGQGRSKRADQVLFNLSIPKYPHVRLICVGQPIAPCGCLLAVWGAGHHCDINPGASPDR